MSFVNDAISVIAQNTRLRKGLGRKFTYPKTRLARDAFKNKIELDQATIQRIEASKAKQSKKEVAFILMYIILALLVLFLILGFLQ